MYHAKSLRTFELYIVQCSCCVVWMVYEGYLDLNIQYAINLENQGWP